MIKIIEDSGEYFIHRSFDNWGKPINLKIRFNKFELFTLFSFDEYDQSDEQSDFNNHHLKDDVGITTTKNLPSKLLPLIKELLIKIINLTHLIKDQKYKRRVRKILYDEIKHINLVMSIKLEYKIYDKVHYFTRYPFYYILFDFIECNEIEVDFNYEIIQTILKTFRDSYLKMNFSKLNFLTKSSYFIIPKPTFIYYCNYKCH